MGRFPPRRKAIHFPEFLLHIQGRVIPQCKRQYHSLPPTQLAIYGLPRQLKELPAIQ